MRYKFSLILHKNKNKIEKKNIKYSKLVNKIHELA